jgi:hypothetical protein
MWFFLHVARVDRSHSSSLRGFVAQLVTTCLVFACMLWLGVWEYSLTSRATERAAEVDFSPGADLAWSSFGMDGQIAVALGNVTINVEAYNRKREKDIADASRKLLSLAISLKSDLEHAPGSGLSRDAIKKAKEIEKLAHDVKETMRINIIGPQDPIGIR